MVAIISQVFAGFSFCASLILLSAYLFFLDDMQKSLVGRASATILLLALATLQLGHLLFFDMAYELMSRRWYGFTLLIVPVSFFFFSREALVPGSTQSRWHALHIVWLLPAPWLPQSWLVPMGFVLGAAYSVWFAMFVFGLRRHVNRFVFELFFFTFFAVLAIVLLVLATSARQIGVDVFHASYSILIGISFVLIVGAMIVFPNSVADVSDAARLVYAHSTLEGVNKAAKLAEVERLMREERLYEDESLSLSRLAAATSLSSHQLSELINTECGYGFSRFVRKHRVDAAKAMLVAEHSASVLSVGLSVGFRSQSNFYAAFREELGVSPGAWRKQAN